MINVGLPAPPTYEESLAVDRCHGEENRPNLANKPKRKTVEIPSLFSTTDIQCVEWCCYSCFCLGCAMAKIGLILNDQMACIYVFFFLVILCVTCLVLPVINYGLEYYGDEPPEDEDLPLHHKIGAKLAKWTNMDIPEWKDEESIALFMSELAFTTAI